MSPDEEAVKRSPIVLSTTMEAKFVEPEMVATEAVALVFLTSRRERGDVVPIPTLPVLLILTFSVKELFSRVEKDKPPLSEAQLSTIPAIRAAGRVLA